MNTDTENTPAPKNSSRNATFCASPPPDQTELTIETEGRDVSAAVAEVRGLVDYGGRGSDID